MSGDVQPRKRKDKKRKKDDLGVEEHRGTAAPLGEGDVLMHSQHEHGTGGHWCAKIIFFSLLAVLVTLIGLIIVENRGLSELEANAVESRYSGVLDGWIEDAPDDDHHDEHTLELKHHGHIEDDDDEHTLETNSHEDEHDGETDDDDDDEEEEDNDDEVEGTDHDDEHEDDADPDEEDDDDDQGEDEDNGEHNENEDETLSKELDDDDDSAEGQEVDDADEDNDEDDDDGSEEQIYEASEGRYQGGDDDDDDDDDDEDDDDGNDDTQEHVGEFEDENDSIADADKDDENNEIQDDDDENNDQSVENDDDDDNNNEDEEDHEDDHEEEAEEEIEKIEKEPTDEEEPTSTELPIPEASVEKEDVSVEVVSPDEIDEVDASEYLEADDLDEPAVERIAPPPPGKPYVEIEDAAVSTEAPPDTLAEEEEYEKQQEQLRQEEEQSSSHMSLKLAVGGALLAATHAVLRRATSARDAPENEIEEHASRGETPLTDRRMTLVDEEAVKLIAPQISQPKVEEETVQKVSSLAKAAPVQKQESEEVEEDVQLDEEVEEDQEVPETKENKELYSDEDENEVDDEVDDEEEIEENVEPPKFVPTVSAAKKEEESEPEEVAEDVEIIDDEQIEEEIEEEVEDEEEISDVDDAELLSRLEAKYGRLPEPERPGPKQKDGGNSVEDDWPNEPSDAFWRQQLDKAEQDLRQGAFGACEERVSAAALSESGRARWLRARALDAAAEAKRDNRVLSQAISAYLQLLKMNERLSDKRLLEVALRTIDRIQFRGTYLNAEPVYRILIRRFPNDVSYRNNLTISFLMANRPELASEVLKETLRLWPNDRVALAHYGFVLKTEQNKLEEAVTYFQKALEGDAGAANEPRFYYHLGDALLQLGRQAEADEVHRRAAELGHFLSPSQRSLYNVPRLQSTPWWDVERTPYAKLARELESSWREILKEGEAAKALYEKEKEGLRERGEWSQLDIFVRGREVPGRCERAPVTCAIVRAEPAARCRRGQVKFSLLSGGSHVRAHVGPTNCRLRMHLALSNTDDTFLRVDKETRQWQVGKVLMFDDSFEHEVWHNGSAARLVLIVDVWHPALTPAERRALPAI